MNHTLFVIIFREMCSASHWLHDVHFYSPMAYMHNGTHIFLWDCVQCY